MKLIDQLTKTRIRSTKVTLNLLDQNEKPLQESFEIFYKSRTTSDVRETQKLALEKAEKKEMLLVSDALSRRLTLIRSEDGSEIVPTLELLDGMEIDNLRIIEKALDEDADPK